MSITILTGLPGSGKSETLITRVNRERQAGRAVLTFLCSDSSILRARPNITKRGRMGCRAGITAEVDHFVSAERCMALIGEAPAGSLLAFDEAQHFGARLVEAWCAAADRGAEVLVASASPAQLEALGRQGHTATQLSLDCQACRQREATTFFVHRDDDRTESVCAACHDRLRADAEREVVERLERGIPYAGEKWIY